MLDAKNIGYRRNGKECFPYDLLQVRTGQPEKVCYRAMERADRHGLIGVGVSLRTGWLTDAGYALLSDEGGMWWCNSHQREATHTDANGEHRCDSALGGITLPCSVVFANMRIEK